MNPTGGNPIEQRVLVLPATRRDGEAISGLMAKAGMACQVCVSPGNVIAELRNGAATLVLTDLALSELGGQQMLRALENQPPWSDLPVLLLGKPGGSFDLRELAAITNFTLLERPTSSLMLLSAVGAALRARTRQYQIRDQLEALHQAHAELREADRRKDEFLAMLAHELRNPLAPIRTASELLPRIVPKGDARVDATISAVRRQVVQLSRLVDDLLDVSRITRGRIELQRATHDLASIIGQAIESTAPLFEGKGHAVVQPVDPPALHVEGDSARLVQCVSNILANAAKYTDRGGRIRIDLREEDGMGVVSVQDNGIGMPAEMLPRVFDLFVQSERSLDRADGGLGIGLSVVRRLIDMHGGQVTAHSAGLGRGSLFEVRLPLVEAPRQAAAQIAHDRSGHHRVLVVDDNRDAADSLALLLRSLGHEVRTAYDGEQALLLAPSFAADMVLLDIGLPQMNGFEVARRLRSDGSAARLVALTGYGQPEDLRLSREAGFDAHLVKPVDFDRVAEVLAGAV
jgi:signal transduction histidine kinase